MFFFVLQVLTVDNGFNCYNLKFSQTNPIRFRSSDLDPIDPERQLTY